MKTLVFLLTLLCFPAMAQQVCGDRAGMVSELAARYHEAPVAQGILNLGQLIQVFASDGGKTWTVLIIQGDVACVATAGNTWQTLRFVGRKS